MSYVPTTPERPVRRALSFVGLAANNASTVDYLAFAFHLFMWLRVMVAPDSPDATMARRFALMLCTVTTCVILLTRGELLRRGPIRALVHRLGLFLPFLLSYFELRFLLPALQPVLIDEQLHAIDKMLVGTTPAVWMANFNIPAVAQVFSFFYYSYFFLMAFMLIPPLLLESGRRLDELLAGAAFICAVGHITYTFVPGAGPHATLVWDEPIHGGFFWEQVLQTIHVAGANLDIFPSLHTAYPTFFALHAVAHRQHGMLRYTWPVVIVFAVPMVIATMFLRWHWFVDVAAGLALAWIAYRFAVATAHREARRGSVEGSGRPGGRQPAWETPWPDPFRSPR